MSRMEFDARIALLGVFILACGLFGSGGPDISRIGFYVFGYGTAGVIGRAVLSRLMPQ